MELKKLSIKIIVLFLCFLLYNTVIAQQKYFTNLGVNDGLSQSVVNCLYLDSKGFIWIGTQNGLNRFDGYTFKKYSHTQGNDFSLVNNWIISITEDEKTNLWIATRGGLHYFNRAENKFYVFTNEPDNNNSLFNNSVYNVIINSQGTVFANTPPFLNVYNKEADNFTRFYSGLPADEAKGDQQLPLLELHNGLIAMGSTTGLAFFNPKTNQFENLLPNNSPLHSAYISALYLDKENHFWIGTRNGVYRFKPDFLSYKYFVNEQDTILGDNFVRAIIEDNEGNIWIGTEGGGLTFLPKSEITQNIPQTVFYKSDPTNQSAISHDIILDILIDNSNNLWLGTLKGLNKTDLKPEKFKLYRNSTDNKSINLLDNVIASLYKDENGLIWVGNWGKGLNIYNRQTGEVKHFSTELSGKQYIVNDYVHVIFKDSQKRIWIGTRSGVEFFNTVDSSFITMNEYFKGYNLPDLTNIRITKIIESHNGEIWLGTQNGLYKFSQDLKNYQHFQKGTADTNISDNLIYDLIEDSKENIWIATSFGLNIYSPLTGKIRQIYHNPDNNNSLCHNFVVSLCEDFLQNMWIGTESGVNCYQQDDSVFLYYSVENGLPHNLTYEILEDNQQNLWFTTGNGLAMFVRKDGTFKTFELKDGLQSMEFNLRASFESKDGEVFFGGMNGFNSFYPDSLKFNTFAPPIVFTNIEIISDEGKRYFDGSCISEIVITPNDYAFTIEFAALEFTAPQENRYAYKIEGVNEEWIETGERHFVPFTNLSPGKYILYVKGANNDGVWNENGSQITIIVVPPWWRSNLAYFIYTLIFAALIILFIKAREQKMIHEKIHLEQKVAERTAEVVHQKEEIEKSNKQIKASINYARRIQNAILPEHKILKDNTNSHFIFFKPREIVSGDFYWFQKINDYLVIVAADCTGHGVPGAFMSMLGIAFISEIIRRKEINKASQALEEMRRQVKISLSQTGKEKEQKDGMDMGIVIVHLPTLETQFSGANNTAHFFVLKKDIIQSDEYYNIPENYEYISIKGDKNPVGIYRRETPFTNHTLQLSPHDRIYLCSDGFVDQVGGEDADKFKIHRLRELFQNNFIKQMHAQSIIMEETFNQWIGENKQIDDILLLGIEI